MCEFCTKHGEGKKWYLQMKNYAKELLHEELSSTQKEMVKGTTRIEYIDRFFETFVMPAISGVPKAPEEVFAALSPSFKHHATPPSEDEILEGQKAVHFGQVLPLEDVEKVIDMVDSITRIPCGCRRHRSGVSGPPRTWKRCRR